MPDLSIERSCGYPSRWVMGVDEVGRGCLAGPVVAAACFFPPVKSDSDLPEWIAKVNDSKKLSPALRESLDPQIRSWSPFFGIGSASVEEIDKINIYHASHLAMKRAIEECRKVWVERVGNLQPFSFSILIDGNAAPKGLLGNVKTVVKGDEKSLSIACA